jgi:3-oxoacyl-[acyl-carrier protein] reductase
MASTQQDLSGRVALVTGASGGIGTALVRSLAQAGCHVAISYNSQNAEAEKLASDVRAQGVRTECFFADLALPGASRELIEAVEAHLGPVDILVANAGLGIQAQVSEIDEALWDRTQAINLRAPFFLAQRAIPGMLARGFGRILFVSSVAAFTGGVVGPHYAASKAGLHGLTHFLASQLAAERITVNALAPALIADTGMLPGPSEALARRIPAGRLGNPTEVAQIAMAMLSNSYMTNQVVSVDGGLYPR